jgi:hypothetical protein
MEEVEEYKAIVVELRQKITILEDDEGQKS